MQYCSGCHSGGSSGGRNVASSYSEAISDSETSGPCKDVQTAAECIPIRLANDSMPLTPTKVPQAGKAIIQAWVDGGFPEK